MIIQPDWMSTAWVGYEWACIGVYSVECMVDVTPR